MADIPKIGLTGFVSILAGFLIAVTGLLMLFNASTTTISQSNLGVFKLIGALTVVVGVVLLVSREE